MSQEDDHGRISVSLRALAASAGLVALASLTSLVVVVAIRGADLLSSVALALAVLAFAIQIIVFAAQATESATSARRSLELHAQLSGLLSELRERTGTTQKSVDVINARLLEAVIGKTNVDRGALGAEEFAEEVASRYAVATRESVSGAESPGLPRQAAEQRRPQRTDYPPPPARDEAERIRAELVAFPSESDARLAMAALRALSADAQIDLMRIARDALKFSTPGNIYGPGVHLVARELIDAGLVKKVKGWRLYTLSPKGRHVGRLLTASGELPEYLKPIADLRQRIMAAHDSRYNRPVDNRDPEDFDA